MTVEATEYSSAFGTEKKPFPFQLTKDEFLKDTETYRVVMNEVYSAVLSQWVQCPCWIINSVKAHHIFFDDGSEYELRLGGFELFTTNGTANFKFINV